MCASGDHGCVFGDTCVSQHFQSRHFTHFFTSWYVMFPTCCALLTHFSTHHGIINPVPFLDCLYNELSMKIADGGRPLFIGARFVCFLFYSTKQKLSPANSLVKVLIDWVL